MAIGRKALVIGINSYPSGNELHGCVNDAIKISEMLERNGDNSMNFDVLTKTDILDSRSAIDLIEGLFSGDQEIALLYFSGHGYADENGAQIVFPNDVTNGSYCIGIKMSDILSIVNKSKVRNKIIILDCCHSGLMGQSDVSDSNSHLSSGVSILTACKGNESAVEYDGCGMFTSVLLEALNGGAADFSGNITVGGIYAYIDRTFGAWQQRPVFKTNVTEFTPIRTIAPKVSLDIIRELTTLFEDSYAQFSLDPSFEETNTPNIEHKVIKPYAVDNNVTKFKTLQKLQSIGFVEPVGEDFMYFAAMNSKACQLTPLGRYYWTLVKGKKI
jgi:hypothetical protein